MNILLIALLPLVAFVLRKRILSISYVIKNNLKERLKSEVLFMSLTISLIIFLFILIEILMP
jgi:hypothetical protein